MDPKELFIKALDEANGCAAQVKVELYNRPTPCTEWNLKQLFNHMVYELSWIPDLLAGKTIDEVGTKYDGDLIGDDPQAAWQKAAKAAREAVEKVDLDATVHLSYGDFSAADYLKDMASDMLIHGWDVDQSINCSLILEPTLAQALYDHWLPRKTEIANSNVFGTPQEVAEDATIATKLLALLGRTTNWQKDAANQDAS